MKAMSEHELLVGLMALAIILIAGRGTAECAKRLGQPEVLGELLGGIVLGPSVLGAVFPHIYHSLFSTIGAALPLSMFSWTGAILLLLLAGAEIDLDLLREYFKAGLSTAIITIGASIIVGAIFGVSIFKQDLASAIFLGGVLSVTAVSVIAKILMERKDVRRNYAQVILATGIASEIAIWPLISILSAVQNGKSLLTGITVSIYAIVFIALMLTIGQKIVNWSMRKIVEMTKIIYGQLSLVVVLAILSAGLTQKLGLHALLGPFIFGLLIGRAPRSTDRLKESIHSMTLSVFAPVFFVTAGMRVDVLKIWDIQNLKLVIALFLVSLLAKILFGALGARLGGLRTLESLLVGIGVNMRGGTDVIVAILGSAVGLISEDIYTIYAVVAILTVIVSPSLFAFVAKKVLPSKDEATRLEKEEAKRRAYLSSVEQILLPSFAELLPAECVPIIKAIAATKESENEIFDILELAPQIDHDPLHEVSDALKESSEAPKIEYNKTEAYGSPLDAVVAVSSRADLIIMGAKRPETDKTFLTFGNLQDTIINTAKKDVFLVVDGRRLITRHIRRIIVLINGMEYSLDAADIAAYIAKATDAEVTFFHAIQGDPTNQKDLSYHRLRRSGFKMLQEPKFRTKRLDIRHKEIVTLDDNIEQQIIDEINRNYYDLLVFGAIDRSNETGLLLGTTTHAILTRTNVPAGMLIVAKKNES